MERVKWTDRIRNEAVLEGVDEERMVLKLIRKRKRNWLGHWLRRNCLLKDSLEGIVNGRRVRGRRYQIELRDIYKDPDITALIASPRLRWLGHVLRRDEDSSTKSFRLFSKMYRPLGRPRLRWQDQVYDNLSTVGGRQEDAENRDE
ncbi:hypothetical protein ANN_14530 [Periplaneta americana]|uniref:Uncharacterized protein n=1 Tax=Periplaneta americana TaxID=6978 RepID=A0ABQ8SWJ1_PERAM|nr:hypothetical protein ANN_14530 [Periplaneta americana]